MGPVYTDYFQKSKVFLYPLLQLRKGLTYVPKQTYIAMEHMHSPEDYRLLCEYHVKMSENFDKFCNTYIKNHPRFDEYIDIGDNKHVFIFDFISFKNDFNKFLVGKYSQFSLNSKMIILDFFSDGRSSDYIEAFLSPENYHEDYADELNVDVKIIESVFELCSLPDINKETLINKNKTLLSLLEMCNVSLPKQN